MAEAIRAGPGSGRSTTTYPSISEALEAGRVESGPSCAGIHQQARGEIQTSGDPADRRDRRVDEGDLGGGVARVSHADDRGEPPDSKLGIAVSDADQLTLQSALTQRINQGHEVWWDRELTAGAEFRPQIQLALDPAEVVIVVWSARSRLSRFVADEADLALSKGTLVPVVIDGAR